MVESEAEKGTWIKNYGMEKNQYEARILELERKVREAKRAVAGGEAMEGVEGVAMEGALSAEEAGLLREEVEALKKALETVGFGFSISILHSLTTLPPLPVQGEDRVSAADDPAEERAGRRLGVPHGGVRRPVRGERSCARGAAAAGSGGVRGYEEDYEADPY